MTLGDVRESRRALMSNIATFTIKKVIFMGQNSYCYGHPMREGVAAFTSFPVWLISAML